MIVLPEMKTFHKIPMLCLVGMAFQDSAYPSNCFFSPKRSRSVDHNTSHTNSPLALRHMAWSMHATHMNTIHQEMRRKKKLKETDTYSTHPNYNKLKCLFGTRIHSQLHVPNTRLHHPVQSWAAENPLRRDRENKQKYVSFIELRLTPSWRLGVERRDDRTRSGMEREKEGRQKKKEKKWYFDHIIYFA